MAIKIGEIAQAYDAFLTAGGKHVPSFFIKSTATQSGVENDQLPKTAGGGSTSTGTHDHAGARMEHLQPGGSSDQ
jgi:hypothetical protein